MSAPSLSRILASRAFQAHNVRNLLGEAIITGEFGHVALPDEHVLAAEYQVSRNVIREALDQLRQDGLVVRLQGSGTFALPPKARHRFDELMGLQDSFGDDVTYSGVQLETVAATRALSLTLDVPRGSDVHHIERIAMLNGRPAVALATYLPGALLPDLPRLDLRRLRHHLAERRLTPVTATVSMSAVPADSSTAALLEVPVGYPLLLVRRLLRLADGSPAEVGYSHYNTAILEPVIEQRRLGDPAESSHPPLAHPPGDP
jgi:GntR family transcriptional regulator